MKKKYAIILSLMLLLFHLLPAFSSQNSIVINNGTGLQVRTATNNALNTIATNFMGSSQPGTTYAGMTWVDTSSSNPILKLRNTSNDAWVTLGTIISGNFQPANTFLSSDSTVTTQGNTFNNASQLVKLNSSGYIPALNGSLLTNLSASNISSGTIDAAYMPTDTIVALGTYSSGTATLTKDKFHTITFSGASTIALPTTGLTSGVHYNCTLLVTMSSIVTITQPTVTWAYGAAPSLTSTSVKYRITYETVNGGSTWYGYWTQLGG